MSLKCKIFKDFGSFKLNIDIESHGGTLALLGPSGSGKSMTLKGIAGVIKPDSGYIELNGRVLFDSEKKVNLPPQKRNIGYLFQDYCLFPNMNVRQNILCGIRKFKLDKGVQEVKLNEMISLLQLDGLELRKPHQLSGGQKQRVALARILIGEPEMLLLDEPFSALDEYLKTRLEMSTKEIIAKYELPTILVTHNRDEAYMLSKETIIIDNGAVIEGGKTQELFRNPHFLMSSVITGCKNNFECHATKDKIIVDSLGIELKVNNVENDIKYIGIRAHSFDEKERENSFPIKVLDVIEQPFENLVIFKYLNQTSDQKIYWFVPKDKIDYTKIKKVGIKTSDILMLK